DGALASAVTVNGVLDVRDHNGVATIGGLSGAGDVRIYNGELALSGGGVFAGRLMDVSGADAASLRLGGGVLDLGGDSRTFTGTLAVEAGATLTGAGAIGGRTAIGTGGALAGVQGQTLTLGSLTL